MKECFTKCFGAEVYIKEIKRHWWCRWEIERTGPMPNLYEYREGQFVNIAAKNVPL